MRAFNLLNANKNKLTKILFHHATIAIATPFPISARHGFLILHLDSVTRPALACIIKSETFLMLPRTLAWKVNGNKRERAQICLWKSNYFYEKTEI